jgi:hypothetical protein
MTSRRIISSVVVLAAVTVTVTTGCGADSGQDSSPSASSSLSSADRKLGKAMDKLVYQGAKSSDDQGQCFIEVLRDNDMSQKGQQVIVDQNSDDWGELEQALRRDSGAADADLFSTGAIRSGVDLCVDQAYGKRDDAGSKASATPSPDLKPSRQIDPNEPITTVEQLAPGIATMFGSFGDDEQARKSKDNSSCMAQAILDAGLSQESLHFLAGGAPLGSSSVVEHLPNEQDKQLWQSQEFVSKLSACTK